MCSGFVNVAIIPRCPARCSSAVKTGDTVLSVTWTGVYYPMQNTITGDIAAKHEELSASAVQAG